MSESTTATYEWHQLPWRKLEVTVCKLERRIYQGDRINLKVLPSL